MSTFQFECTYCKYITKKYNTWRQHLLQESHQIKTREKSRAWSMKNLKKAVVVFGLGFTTVSQTEVLKHFADLSLVSDYIFWNERPDFCIVKFLTTKFRRYVMSTSQVIGSQEMFLRPREEITELEWVSICPFQAQRVNTEVHLEKSVLNSECIDSSDSEENNNKDTFYHDPALHPVPNHSNCDQNHLECSHIASSLSTEVSESDHTKNDKEGSGMNPTINEDQMESIRVRQDLFESDDHEDPMDDMDIGNYDGSDCEGTWNDKLVDLFNDNLMDKSAWKLRNEAKIFVQELLQRKYPSCVLIPFGCFGTAISSGNEKFFMFFDAYGHTNRTNYKDPLQMDISNEELQERKSSIFLELVIQSRSRSEICSHVTLSNDEDFAIEFQYFGLRCKICLNSFLVAQSCRVIEFLCKLDDRVRPLLIIARHWALNHKLVKSGNRVSREGECFRPAMFDWLVVFYLIHSNILPKISMLQDSASVKLMYYGVDIAFCSDRKLIEWKGNSKFETDPVTGNPSAKCVLQLAQNMFQLWGDIELRTNIISPNTGHVIPIKSLDSFDLEYRNPFRSNTDLQRTKNMTSMPSYVFIQHPLKLSHNMTFNVQRSIAMTFTDACKYTSQRLELLLNGRLESPNPVDLLTPDPERRYEDLQSSNVVPTVTISPEVEKKKINVNTKRQAFTIQLSISKDFRTKAKTVKNSTMEKAIHDNLSAVWMKFLTDFNMLLWPVCYSIKTTPIPHPDLSGKNESLLGEPFKGVLVYPESMRWTYRNKQIYNNAFNEFSKILKAATPQSIPILPDAILDANSEDSLMFECKIVYITSDSMKRSKERGEARLFFTKVRGSMIHGINSKKRFQEMYNRLWEMYWNHRLFCKTVDLH